MWATLGKQRIRPFHFKNVLSLASFPPECLRCAGSHHEVQKKYDWKNETILQCSGSTCHNSPLILILIILQVYIKKLVVINYGVTHLTQNLSNLKSIVSLILKTYKIQSWFVPLLIFLIKQHQNWDRALYVFMILLNLTQLVVTCHNITAFTNLKDHGKALN